MFLKVEPVVHREIQGLCRRPYPDHPRGCPNYGHKEGCPPFVPLFDEKYDCTQGVYAIITEFDLKEHAGRMKAKHPLWTERQCRNLLFWQGKARKNLKAEISRFLVSHPRHGVEMAPEALGVNVTRTLRNVGIYLEWPPRDIARQVAMAALPRFGDGNRRSVRLRISQAP